jgi:hypothetical protein
MGNNKTMKHIFACLALSAVAISTSSAQYNWSAWTYPSSTNATTSVGSGAVSLTLTGTTSSLLSIVDDPVQYQGTPFTQLFGDSAGAVNFGSTSFQMQLNFTGFTSTAGLVLAIGQLAHVQGASGYVMSAFNSSNQAIPLNTFGLLGNYDFGNPLNGNFFFNDDLSLNTNNGGFHVTTVAGQDDLNSDMLLLSLPAGVSKILINLQSPTTPTGDTINFMVAPVPEPQSTAFLVVGGIAALLFCGRKLRVASR